MYKPEPSIRVATENDYHVIYQGRMEIRAIEQYDQDGPIQKEEVMNAIQKQRIWMAYVEEKPAGYIWMVRSVKCPFGVDYADQEDEFIFIDFVWVAKEWRNRGIGKCLYQFAEKYAKDNGLKEIVLDVMTKNVNSHEFHTHIGYNPFCTLYRKRIQ
jgi:GNAT superfamily N-acetyltransferase